MTCGCKRLDDYISLSLSLSLDPSVLIETSMYMYALVAPNMSMQVLQKCGPSGLMNFGPSCHINLGRAFCGPSWHGLSRFWAELSVILPNVL